MVSAATPIFYTSVEATLSWITLVVLIAFELVAFFNCLTQKAEAFPTIGPLSKTAWLLILVGSVLFTALCGAPPLGGILGLLGTIAALVYMVDVRPALRDATDGSGPW